ncbi:hypothetical protein CLG96_08855 [Sphingomonas oleivorans]|uniref:YitT family protein n=1 Tax=Sphingomonas oleivorans TaxID=1735121 RepID=A0A2T5FYB7_9SPHN|nr:YitT family protein [Sphingomonas oleivorans]PTQ11533.1 hypothetical protein CLG96_08855 [Sphingomonas oleivorans]
MDRTGESRSIRHSPAEDAHALLLSTSFIAVGLFLLHAAGLTTGGLAGIALLASYFVALPAGMLFVLLNIPFYFFAWRGLGMAFAIKTMIVSLLIGGMALMLPRLIMLAGLNDYFAAIFGGTIIGMGILGLARHRASVGGVGVLALYLQERRGIRAGIVQMAADVAIVLASLVVLAPARALLSIVSAVAVNLVLAIYHKPGRYAGY